MSETKHPSTAEQIFLDLRTQIMTGELPPGSRHSIYALADTLQASRTPVREAVLRLADLHLVTIHKNRGVVVRHIDPAQIEAIFEMRFLVEGAAAAHAARQSTDAILDRLTELSAQMRTACERDSESDFLIADRAWHETIISGLANSWADRQVQSLRYATPPSIDHQTPRSIRLQSILAEHDAIEQAIAHHDPVAAIRATQMHLEETARSLLDGQSLSELGDSWPSTLRRHFVTEE